MANDIVIDKATQKEIDILADAVTKALGSNGGNKRFIDLERIPLICLAISNMSKGIDEIKQMMEKNQKESDEQHEAFLTKESFEQQFSPVRMIVFGGIGLALIALATAVVSQVIK